MDIEVLSVSDHQWIKQDQAPNHHLTSSSHYLGVSVLDLLVPSYEDTVLKQEFNTVLPYLGPQKVKEVQL